MEVIEYQSMHAQEEHFWWYRALHNIIVDRVQQLSLPAHARLLDAGCGTGGLLRKLHQAFPDYQLTGLEYHAEGLRYLCALPDINIINGNVNSMPFANNHFDAVTLTDVLYHENIRPHDCLSECFRILKPQGHLLINVSAYNWMRSTHDKQVHTRERYTAKRCKEQLLEAGFQLCHVGYWNSLLFPLMALHRITSGKIKQTSDVESLSHWQDNLFYRVIHTEQYLQRHHVHLPFGGSVWAWASKA